MDLYQEIDKAFEKYHDYLDLLIGAAFVREPDSDDLRALVGLTDDAAFVGAFEDFMAIAHDTFRWSDYYEARTTAEAAFRKFYESRHFAKADEEQAVNAFIISFFNACIDDQQLIWESEHQKAEYDRPHDSEDDIDTLYFARCLSFASEFPGAEENLAFCMTLGLEHDYEQLHMCCWFSSQVTKGGGKYSRDVENTSARTTYNHLMNPWSLLWIGTVMGADRAELKAASDEMKNKKSNQAKCAVVRRHVPFDEILRLYRILMTDEAE